jgi:hypothetical protein
VGKDGFHVRVKVQIPVLALVPESVFPQSGGGSAREGQGPPGIITLVTPGTTALGSLPLLAALVDRQGHPHPGGWAKRVRRGGGRVGWGRLCQDGTEPLGLATEPPSWNPTQFPL